MRRLKNNDNVVGLNSMSDMAMPKAEWQKCANVLGITVEACRQLAEYSIFSDQRSPAQVFTDIIYELPSGNETLEQIKETVRWVAPGKDKKFVEFVKANPRFEHLLAQLVIAGLV